MAIAEHEITQQLTLTLSEDLREKIEQAAFASDQTIGDFIMSSLRQAAEAVSEPRLTISAFGDSSDRIQEETDTVLFTSYDGTTREVGPLPPNLGRATALANQKAVGKIWGASEEESACRSMQKVT